MSLEKLLNCRMAKQLPFVLIFYSWSVKYVPWNPLHASHNLKGRLWSCIYLGTYVILCISRHWAQFCNYFQHLSVYSQALLSMILLLSSLLFHVFNSCRGTTISPLYPQVFHVTEIPAHQNSQLLVRWMLTCLCIFFINLSHKQ